jgi:pSer/pThr/pTyr-binding forkhead associated (FHA) protein
LTSTSYRIGRQDRNDIVIHAEVVSREHAILELRDTDWVYKDLQSRNGTYVDGARVEKITLYDGINLQMGKNPKTAVSITFHLAARPIFKSKSEAHETVIQPRESTTGLVQMRPPHSSDKQVQIIGRGSEADIQLPSPSASRRHASLQASQPEWLLNDLNSKNGTFLNGKRIYTPQRLKTGDIIQIASFRLGEKVKAGSRHLQPARACDWMELT